MHVRTGKRRLARHPDDLAVFPDRLTWRKRMKRELVTQRDVLGKLDFNPLAGPVDPDAFSGREVPQRGRHVVRWMEHKRGGDDAAAVRV